MASCERANILADWGFCATTAIQTHMLERAHTRGDRYICALGVTRLVVCWRRSGFSDDALRWGQRQCFCLLLPHYLSRQDILWGLYRFKVKKMLRCHLWCEEHEFSEQQINYKWMNFLNSWLQTSFLELNRTWHWVVILTETASPCNAVILSMWCKVTFQACRKLDWNMQKQCG